MTEVVPRRENDNDSSRDHNRGARHVRLDEPDISEDACHDGGREWHAPILSASYSSSTVPIGRHWSARRAFCEDGYTWTTRRKQARHGATSGAQAAGETASTIGAATA